MDIGFSVVLIYVIPHNFTHYIFQKNDEIKKSFYNPKVKNSDHKNNFKKYISNVEIQFL